MRGENRSTREKTSRSREPTNLLNPHMTSDQGIEPGPPGSHSGSHHCANTAPNVSNISSLQISRRNMFTCNAIMCFVSENFAQDCRLLKFRDYSQSNSKGKYHTTEGPESELIKDFRAAVRHSEALRSDKPNCSMLISTQT